MDALPLLVNVILFAVTVLWVGRKPTMSRVAVMVLVVAVAEFGSDSAQFYAQGLSFVDGYQQYLNQVVDAYVETYEQVDASMRGTLEQTASTIMGLLPAIYLLEAALEVFAGLGITWAVKRLFKRPMGWMAFSKVDLPIWTVFPLIAGVLLFAASNVPGVPYGNVVYLVALNLLLMGGLFPVVQGAAAGKGVMNNAKLAGPVQGLLIVISVFFGVAALVLPLVGLIDYWANLRKLPRGGQED